MSKLNLSTPSNFTTGIMVTLMGGFIFAIGFGVIPVDPSEINVPPWIIALFGGMFVLAGLWTMLRTAVKAESAAAGWMNFVFALLVLAALSALCLWIAFGAGDQMFTNSSGNPINRHYVQVDPGVGRFFFGLFGLLLSGVTVAVASLHGRKLLKKKDETGG
jgi:hypothetical protein